MKVAVPAQGKGMDSQVDPRFGRCLYFVVVDTETMRHESLPNPGVDAPGGAGMKTAQALVQAGVSAVIVGNVGPNAISALQAARIDAYSGVSGTVAEAVEAYKGGNLAPITGPTVSQHFGAGRI
ncbi:MAG: NifB/NifX family molybdenum-iron cluster-binding protein [Firmicutes bacterium]|nr:NifB/NifX family molybdenum-iron cluster-binding protein [Bacillota bacterium]